MSFDVVPKTVSVGAEVTSGDRLLQRWLPWKPPGMHDRREWTALYVGSLAAWMMPPLPSNRHHPSSVDCLEGKRENYQICSVQYCVQQLCTVQCTHI